LLPQGLNVSHYGLLFTSLAQGLVGAKQRVPPLFFSRECFVS
jgi:hypothetical protein